MANRIQWDYQDDTGTPISEDISIDKKKPQAFNQGAERKLSPDYSSSKPLTQGWRNEKPLGAEHTYQFSRADTFLLELERRGVAHWSALTNYSVPAIVWGSNELLYTALQNSGPDTTPKDPVSNPAYWRLYIEPPTQYYESDYAAGVYTAVPFSGVGYGSSILDGDVIPVLISTTNSVTSTFKLSIGDKTNKNILEPNEDPISTNRLIKNSSYDFVYNQSLDSFICLTPRAMPAIQYYETSYGSSIYTVVPYGGSGYRENIVDGDVIDVLINTTNEGISVEKLSVGDKTNKNILEPNQEQIGINRLIAYNTYRFVYDESLDSFICLTKRIMPQEIIFEHRADLYDDGGAIGGAAADIGTRPITHIRFSDFKNDTGLKDFKVNFDTVNTFKPAIGTYEVLITGVFGETNGFRQWLKNETLGTDYIPGSISTSGEIASPAAGANATCRIEGRFYFNGTDIISIKGQHTDNSTSINARAWGEASGQELPSLKPCGYEYELFNVAKFKRIAFTDIT